MRSALGVLAAALLLAAPALAAGAKKKKKARALPRPSKAVEEPAPAKAAAAPPASEAPAIPAAPPPPRREDPRQVAAAEGLLLEPGALGPRALDVLPRSPAQDLGLKTGDVLLSFNGARAADPAAAAQAIESLPAASRSDALVERGFELEFLSERSGAASAPPARSAAALTPREERLRAQRLAAADEAVPQRVQAMRAPPLRIPAGASLWIRFPNGIPAEAKAGDILEGVATSGLATDSRLDFLGVQPGSRVWAQVVSASPRQGASTVKLHVYKLGLKGGHTYPVSAILTDVSGDSSLLKVSPGGTLVASVGNEELSLAGPERNFLAKLLKPVDVFEGPEYYAAGPGLWFKTVEDGLARRLEVTQVVAKRSAEAAGLKPGDRILEIDGTAASKLDFSEAVSRLYGPPGSAVRLKVLRVDKGVYDSPRLQRGVFYRKGTGIFAAPGEHAPLASRVLPGSPAEKAGIREGDSLLQAGATNLAGMSESQLGALLQGDLVGDKELVVQTPGKAPRAVPIAADLFPTVIRVDALLARGAQKQP